MVYNDVGFKNNVISLNYFFFASPRLRGGYFTAKTLRRKGDFFRTFPRLCGGKLKSRFKLP